jgi:hypothetical protein
MGMVSKEVLHVQFLYFQYLIKVSEKSQNRHTYYCRKSKSRNVRTRKKACLTCTKAKTLCDLTYPSCSRCTAKNFLCVYERPPIVKTPEVPLPAPAAHPVELELGLSSTLDFTTQLSIPGESDLYDPSQSSGFSSTELVCPGRWDSEFIDSITALEKTIPPLAYQHGGTLCVTHAQFGRICKDFGYVQLLDNLLQNQTSVKSPRAFLPKTTGETQFSLNKKYVLCTLRSYPYMMLAGKILPPFIHPKSATNNSDDPLDDSKLLGPLANCAAIVQMCSVKNKTNTVFIWKTIRMEQERLLAEVCPNFFFFFF